MGKRKNTIVAVHEGVVRPYQWYIPRRFSKQIDKGSKVVVNTRFGLKTVTVIKKRRINGSRFIHKSVVNVVNE